MKSQQRRALKAHLCVGISLIQDKRGNYTGVQFKLVTGSTSIPPSQEPKDYVFPLPLGCVRKISNVKFPTKLLQKEV